MDKQKQFDEMVVNLLAAYNGARQFEGTLMLDTIFDMAKYLVNKYQPKIPEGAIVLTDKKDIQQYEWSKLCDKMGLFKLMEKNYIEARKDIAKEILKEMESVKQYAGKSGRIADRLGATIAINTIKEILKSKGVEVE